MKTKLTTTVGVSSGESMGLGSGRIFDAGMRSPRRGEVREEAVVRGAAMRMLLKGVDVGIVTKDQAIVRMLLMNTARHFDVRTFHDSRSGERSCLIVRMVHF